MIHSIITESLLSAEVLYVLFMMLGVLSASTILFFALDKLMPTKDFGEILVRIKSWWIIISIGFVLLFLNKKVATIGLGFLSFVALRELLSALNLRLSDRRVVLWCFLIIPIQYYLAYINDFSMFITFIPVVMFLFIPIRSVIVGDTINATRSFTAIQYSLMLTVFSFSHIAFLVNIKATPDVYFTAGNGGIVVYLILLTQFNDVLQFLWGKSIGKKKILPKVSPGKTWEGFLGGVLTTTVIGYYLRFLTPMTPGQSVIIAVTIGVGGFFGDVVVSLIKRDFGIKDMGNLIPGHGGIMDRIDSLSYTGMIYTHLLYGMSYGSY